MESEKSIKQKIEGIKNDESRLYSYLYNLTYKEVTKNAKFLEDIYVTFLDDTRIEIKRVSIYCLLFGLKIRKDRYKNIALLHLQDIEADFDLRLACISGLSQAYLESKDCEIVTVFYSVYKNEAEDGDIRSECFTGLLRLLGVTTVELIQINGALIVGLDDIDLNKFSGYFAEIECLIANKPS